MNLVHWLPTSGCSRIVTSWRNIKGPTRNILWVKFLVSLWLRMFLVRSWWKLLLWSLLLMLILLSFYCKHHGSLILVLLLINFVFIIIVFSLCHEKAAATSLRANISLVLSPIEVLWLWSTLFFSLPSCTFLDTESSITNSLVGRVERFRSTISNSHSRASLHLENFLSHEPIFLSKNFNFIIVVNHFFKLCIFFFQDK